MVYASVFGWIVFIAIWVALAFWPARVAGRKGHSFLGYFVFSLFLFPVALIAAYMVHERPVRARTEDLVGQRCNTRGCSISVLPRSVWTSNLEEHGNGYWTGAVVGVGV